MVYRIQLEEPNSSEYVQNQAGTLPFPPYRILRSKFVNSNKIYANMINANAREKFIVLNNNANSKIKNRKIINIFAFSSQNIELTSIKQTTLNKQKSQKDIA